MIPELKQFIEENIDLISDNEFNDIYNKIKSYSFTRLFTEAMLEAEINPLNYTEAVPPRYLYESNIHHVDIPVGIIVITVNFICDVIKAVVYYLIVCIRVLII